MFGNLKIKRLENRNKSFGFTRLKVVSVDEVSRLVEMVCTVSQDCHQIDLLIASTRLVPHLLLEVKEKQTVVMKGSTTDGVVTEYEEP